MRSLSTGYALMPPLPRALSAPGVQVAPPGAMPPPRSSLDEQELARAGQLGLVRGEHVLGRVELRVGRLRDRVAQAHVVHGADPLARPRATARLFAEPVLHVEPAPAQSVTFAPVLNVGATVEVSRTVHGSGVPRGLSSV